MKILNQRLTRAHLAAVALAVAGLAGPARADYRSTVLSQGPVGFWDLDETTQPPVLPIAAADSGSLGSAADGQLVNGPVRGEPGIVGKSYRFSNPGWVVGYVGTYVDASNPALNPNGSFTVEFWAKPSSMPPDLFSPVCSLDTSLNGGNSRNGYILYADGAAGRWQFRVGGTAGYASTSSGGTLDPNGWQHVVGVYTGDSTILYVNGVPVATNAASGFAPNTTQPFRIGATTIPNRTFDGWVDEVAFYGAVLDANTIKAHYDAATTNAAGYSTQILANSPLGYWRLEEPGDPVAANLGTLGAAANGSYIYKARPGVGGPVPPSYPGFDAANKSVAFDGSGGYVSIPALNLNTNTVTITGWINATNSQKAGTGLIFTRSGTTIAGLTIDPNFDGLGLGYNWGGDQATTAWSPTVDSSLTPLPDSKWAFVALVVQPSQAAIFIGPSSDASTFMGVTNLTSHAPQGFEGPTLLGADVTGTPLYLNGAMDEVAIFNRSLGAGEVFSQYAAAVGGVGPVIFNDPQTPLDTVYEGDKLVLTVDAGGTPDLSYQWRKDNQPLAGATSSAYVNPNITQLDAGNYDVVVTNAFGSKTSQAATITVTPATSPAVSQGPIGRTLYPGGTLSLTVTATGGQLAYQWQKDNAPIAGATTSAYTVPFVDTNNSGIYQVTITNRLGTASAGPVTVTVVAPAAGSYEEAVVYDEPEAWWRLDDSTGATVMTDSLGRHDGTYSGNVVLGDPGVVAGDANTAATFDGTGYGSAPFFPAFNSLEFTIECWVKTADLTDELVPVSDYYSGLGWFLWSAVPSAGQWSGGVGVGSPPTDYYVPTSVAADGMRSNVWTQLVMTDDPNNGLLVFINGQWDGRAWADPGRNTGGPFVIGGKGGSSGQGPSSLWKGQVDEVSYYNYALSLDQVQAHYAAALYGNASKPVFKLQPQSQSAVVGSSVTFRARVEGTVPITLQWWKGNAPLTNETTDTLTLASVASGDSGNYELRATNSVGDASSTVATLSVLPVPSSVNLTNGLVLHLKFDNDLTDASGLGNNGIAGGNPSFIAGHIGSGAVLLNTDNAQGIANYVGLPLTNSLTFGPNDSFSVSIWINYTNNADNSFPDDLPIIGNSLNSTYQKGWVFADDTGQFEWTLVGTDNTAVIADPVGGPTINDSQWHNLVLSVDRSVGLANTYIDGAQIDTREIQGLGGFDNGYAITLGQDPSGVYQVDGTFRIDDVGIWRRALSTYEAQAISAVGQAGNSFDVPASAAPPAVSIAQQGASLVITYTGTLQSSSTVGGTYTDVQGASSPYTVPTGSATMQFYRARN